jgi:hypothetical protein
VALEVRIETLFPVSPDRAPGSDADDDVRAGEKLAGFLETSQWNRASLFCSKSFGSSSDDLYIEACGAHLSKVRKIIESNQERRTELEEQVRQATGTCHWHNVISTAAAILADHPDDNVARGHWEMATNALDRKYRRERNWAALLIGILLVIGCYPAQMEYLRLRVLGLENKAKQEEVPKSWREKFQTQREQGETKLVEREFRSALTIFSSLGDQIKKAISANEARKKFEGEKVKALGDFEATSFFEELQKTLKTEAEKDAEKGKYPSAKMHWKQARTRLKKHRPAFESMHVRLKGFTNAEKELKKSLAKFSGFSSKDDFQSLRIAKEKYGDFDDLPDFDEKRYQQARKICDYFNDYEQNMKKLRRARDGEKWGEVIDFGNTARQNLKKLRDLGADGYATPDKFEEIAAATKTARVELEQKCKKFLSKDARKPGDFAELKKWLGIYNRTIMKLAGEPASFAVECREGLERFNDTQESARMGLEHYEAERYTKAKQVLQRAIEEYQKLKVDDAVYAELRQKIAACKTMKQLEDMKQGLLDDSYDSGALENFKLKIRDIAEAGKKDAPSEREKIESALRSLVEEASVYEEIEKIKRILEDADREIIICTSSSDLSRIKKRTEAQLELFGKTARNRTKSSEDSLRKKLSLREMKCREWKQEVKEIKQISTKAKKDMQRVKNRKERRKIERKAAEKISSGFSKEAQDLAEESGWVILL